MVVVMSVGSISGDDLFQANFLQIGMIGLGRWGAIMEAANPGRSSEGDDDGPTCLVSYEKGAL